MPTLPKDYLNLIQVFVPLFSNLVWQHAQVLLMGAILTSGPRTVSATLQIMGLGLEKHFQTYHRVLNRAAWSSWQVSRVLLGVLVQTFAASGPVIVGLDDTIERRRGAKIKAKGIYRDPVRSSHSHFVKASGLPALVEPDVVGTHSLGAACVGFAVSDSVGPVGALLSGAGPDSEEADRLGAARNFASAPLAAAASAGHCRR